MASYNTLKKMSYNDLKRRFESIIGQPAFIDDRPLSRPEIIQALVDVDAGESTIIIDGNEFSVPYADLNREDISDEDTQVDIQQTAEKGTAVLENSITEQKMEDLRNQYFEVTGNDPLADGVYDDPDAMAAEIANYFSSAPEESEKDEVPEEENDEQEADESSQPTSSQEQPIDENGPVLTRNGRVKLTESILRATSLVAIEFNAEDVAKHVNGWLLANGEDEITVSYVRAYLQHFVRKGNLVRSGTGKSVKYSRA